MSDNLNSSFSHFASKDAAVESIIELLCDEDILKSVFIGLSSRYCEADRYIEARILINALEKLQDICDNPF